MCEEAREYCSVVSRERARGDRDTQADRQTMEEICRGVGGERGTSTRATSDGVLTDACGARAGAFEHAKQQFLASHNACTTSFASVIACGQDVYTLCEKKLHRSTYKNMKDV